MQRDHYQAACELYLQDSRLGEVVGIVLEKTDIIQPVLKYHIYYSD